MSAQIERNRMGLEYEIETNVVGHVVVSRACVMCGVTHHYCIKMPRHSFLKHWDRWILGESVQDVFSYVKPHVREFIMSGLCNECFEEITGKPEDYEDEPEDD